MPVEHGLKLDVGDGKVFLELYLERLDADAEGAGMQSKGLARNARVMSYIDRRKLPLWVRREECYACGSESTTTAAYFRSKLMKQRHVYRGIVATQGSGFCMFFAQQTQDGGVYQIRCVVLDFTLKQQLDRGLWQAPKRTTPLELLVARRRDSLLRNRSRVSTHAQIADFRRQFSKTCASCVLSGLRLRGIPETHPEFQALFKTTLATVEFAHRHDMSAPREPLGFETVQESVETVLKLFTSS
ncbi:LADA_0A01662g1_1 [Lachancea dasiensis]|uniref:Mitochondrial morphogenesis protein SLD7 n=1 Tax=Lachancea dasiensis TaxID=1072105 RepID=A0A1G4IM72_9SACH|nr:LADA_0A01662g1_1 [Lachancea dasiensis]